MLHQGISKTQLRMNQTTDVQKEQVEDSGGSWPLKVPFSGDQSVFSLFNSSAELAEVGWLLRTVLTLGTFFT